MQVQSMRKDLESTNEKGDLMVRSMNYSQEITSGESCWFCE